MFSYLILNKRTGFGGNENDSMYQPILTKWFLTQITNSFKAQSPIPQKRKAHAQSLG